MRSRVAVSADDGVPHRLESDGTDERIIVGTRRPHPSGKNAGSVSAAMPRRGSWKGTHPADVRLPLQLANI